VCGWMGVSVGVCVWGEGHSVCMYVGGCEWGLGIGDGGQ